MTILLMILVSWLSAPAPRDQPLPTPVLCGYPADFAKAHGVPVCETVKPKRDLASN